MISALYKNSLLAACLITPNFNNKKSSLFSSSTNIDASISLDNNLMEVDVPHDGNCLFWAVAINYLLPAINNETEFETKFANIFGKLIV